LTVSQPTESLPPSRAADLHRSPPAASSTKSPARIDPTVMARKLQIVPTLLVATTNPGKIREIRGILAGGPFQLITLADWPHVGPPEETGRTFEQNAREKAVYYADATGQLTVAEDSGLEIDALGGQPGIESARFGGAAATYPEKFSIIYEALRVKGAIDSPARFVCALALVQGGKVLFEARGTVEGRIAREPKGEGGFGYDPIFFYPPLGRTLAEAADVKAAISHRGAAFRQLREFLLQRQP
jgi:XTP/dITP diphosphohydrolase